MENMQPLVSIVVPIFNGQEFLQDLYNNFIKQTYKNWEVLFVNDISTDGTLSIIYAYEKQDSRFRVLNRETKGGTAVKGIEYAMPYCRGDFFFFMSHDDFMESTFLEKCVKRALDTGADVVIPNLILYGGEDNQRKQGIYPIEGDYDSELQPREAFYLSLDWHIHSNTFKTMDLVKRVGYKAEYYNSCEFYGRKMFLEANKIVFCNTNFYYRQNNPKAITKNFHYFQVDILTTDIMLAEIMHEQEYEKKLQRVQLRRITQSFWSWMKTCVRTEMSWKHRWYMCKSIVRAGGKLLSLWIKVM